METYERGEVVENYGISRALPNGILTEYVCKVIKQCGNPRSILDAGFGTGTVLFPFREQFGGRVIGIDSSKAMYDAVNEDLRANGIELILGRLEKAASLVDEGVDVVHMKAVTHLLKEPEMNLLFLSNVVKKGGYLVLGREYSQPEDNLEDIERYGYQGEGVDRELKCFYKEYFKERIRIGKEFFTPVMPAGDVEYACNLLKTQGFSQNGEVKTKNWKKQLNFGQLIKAMELGTFNVFNNGLDKEEKSKLGKHMRNYCNWNSYNLKEVRSYKARLEACVLKKEGI